jgi:hypothetical protein
VLLVTRDNRPQVINQVLDWLTRGELSHQQSRY